MGRKLILLDTNVWRYLHDSQRAGELKRIQSKARHKIKITVASAEFPIAKPLKIRSGEEGVSDLFVFLHSL